MTDKDSGLLDSVTNALRILKSFSTSVPVKRVGDIAKEIGVSKSTASRLVKTLVAEGFLEKDTESQGYKLGFTTLSLGGVFASSNDLYSEIAPVVNKVVTLSKESGHLAIMAGWELVYLIKTYGPYYSNVRTQTGERSPLHATSSGKVLLAYCPRDKWDQYLHLDLQAYTEHTIVNPIKFRNELEKIRQQGYSVSIGEYVLENYAIAAPVFNMEGKVVCAIGLAGPLSRLKSNQLDEKIRIIIQASKEASERLGYDG